MRLNRILIAATVCVFAAAAIVALTKWLGGRAPTARVEPGAGTVALLVVGVEGLEPSIVDRMVAEGRLPNLSRLLAEGAAAQFPSFPRGTDRRISWTSLMTGVSPERQGVGALIESPRGGTMPAPLQPSSRTVDTIWTLLSKGGTEVAVLGWPGTWPVEQVRGLMVGPYDTYVLERAHTARMEEAVYPPEAYASVDSLFREQAEFSRGDLARFVREDSAMGLEALIGQNLVVLADARAEAASMLNLARHASVNLGAKAVFVHLRGIDSVSQRFWHYAHPELFVNAPIRGEQRRLFEQESQALGGTIEGYYEYFDELLGELMGVLAEGGTVAVLADHGYSGIKFDERGNPQIGASMHSEQGFLVLRGPKVSPGVRVGDASLLDVAPTIMAATGIPVPAAVEGRVVTRMVRP